IIFAPNAVFFTVFILTTKVFQIVHDVVPETQLLAAPHVGTNEETYQISGNASMLIDHKELI
ncbi:MAG: hypothetical protein LBT05_15560, partial [Planctomycetaceae bacterium]|nr:hypothetical protein [Planctomycetaceae bacterium]